MKIGWVPILNAYLSKIELSVAFWQVFWIWNKVLIRLFWRNTHFKLQLNQFSKIREINVCHMSIWRPLSLIERINCNFFQFEFCGVENEIFVLHKLVRIFSESQNLKRWGSWICDCNLNVSFQDSSNKLDLSQISSDQLTELISKSAGVESTQSNRSQETGSHLSSPLTGTKCNVHTLGFFKRNSI